MPELDETEGGGALPKPHDGMSGEEKGRLILRYLKSGTPLKKLDFSGADLEGTNLEGAELSGVDLRGANLRGANLRGANLFEAALGRANLGRANLGRAYLSGTNLEGANLEGANLFEAALGRASLFGANLGRANLSGANLSGANLSGANLAGAHLGRAALFGANLFGANLFGANLFEADLEGAAFEGAELSGVDLHGANFGRFKRKRHIETRIYEFRRAGVPKPGLLLHLNTSLTLREQALLLALTRVVSGSDTDTRIAEYAEKPGGSCIRLDASDPNHLLELAHFLKNPGSFRMGDSPTSEPEESPEHRTWLERLASQAPLVPRADFERIRKENKALREENAVLRQQAEADEALREEVARLQGKIEVLEQWTPANQIEGEDAEGDEDADKPKLPAVYKGAQRFGKLVRVLYEILVGAMGV